MSDAKAPVCTCAVCAHIKYASPNILAIETEYPLEWAIITRFQFVHWPRILNMLRTQLHLELICNVIALLEIEHADRHIVEVNVSYIVCD